MSVYELDISWAATASERRRLHWELLACEKVLGVFLTAREDVLGVLFAGDRLDFRTWAEAFEPGPHETEALAIELPLALLCIWVAQTPRPRQPLTTAHTDQKGALQ